MFRYKAVSKDGKKITGTLEAQDEYEAVVRLKETHTVVTGITAVRGTHKEKLSDGKISEKSLAVMCSQFSIILGAGLPMVRAIELIAGQTADKTLKKILKQAAADVAAGFSLAQSLKSRSRNLPVTFIETVRSGEESGTLEVSFRRLQDYYSKSFRMKSKVRAAMIYPMFTLAVAIIVIIIIMVVAVPAFTQSFASMGGELPWVTKVLIAMSDFFTGYWIFLAVATAAALLLYRWLGHTEQGGLLRARRRLKSPVLGKINRLKASAQFANTLSTLLAAGIPVLQAVTVTASVLDNEWVGTSIGKHASGLEEGKNLSSCLRTAGVLPDMLTEMVGIGEETGTLEHTLDVIGSYYDNETEMASQKAVSLLEPVIICILAFVVAFILLSVYLPMITLYTNMG
ncbi:type II secretion system F family protein [Lachnospiraceae bacterium 54-53]